jgi:hypothetical protein
VLTPRPALTWPAGDGAAGYELRFFVGNGADRRLVWKAAATGPRLPFPEK